MAQQDLEAVSAVSSRPDAPDPEGEAPDAKKPNGKGADSRTILIVEDDFLIAMEAETALSDAGFRVSGVAATAEEALALAKEDRPSLVIMDVRLAGQRDGIDAAGDLFRELGLRCFFVTAHDDLDTRARAEPFAPVGWLAKPYSMGSLIALVRQAVRKAD